MSVKDKFIIICRFAAQETYIIILSMLKTVFAA